MLLYHLVIINKGFKRKLILCPEQKEASNHYAGCNRLIYNIGLDQCQLAYQLCKKHVSYYDQAKELKDLKKAVPFLKQVPAQTLQQSLKDLHITFDRFFKGISGYPDYRRKFENDSFRFPEPKEFRITRLSKRKGSINLPKLGICKFWWDKDDPITGKPLSATVKREAGTWYISITCEIEIPDPLVISPEIAMSATALDRGCNNLTSFPTASIYTTLSEDGQETLFLDDPQVAHLLSITDTPEIDDPRYGKLISLRKDVISKYEQKITHYQ